MKHWRHLCFSKKYVPQIKNFLKNEKFPFLHFGQNKHQKGLFIIFSGQKAIFWILWGIFGPTNLGYLYRKGFFFLIKNFNGSAYQIPVFENMGLKFGEFAIFSNSIWFEWNSKIKRPSFWYFLAFKNALKASEFVLSYKCP